MGIEALAAVLARFAVAILQWWVAREDIKRGERQRLLIEQLGLERAALEWVAEALRDPARAATLRVRHGAGRLEGFSAAPDPAGGTDPGALPGRQ